MCRCAPATIASISAAAHLRLQLSTRVVRAQARRRDSQQISAMKIRSASMSGHAGLAFGSRVTL